MRGVSTNAFADSARAMASHSTTSRDDAPFSSQSSSSSQTSNSSSRCDLSKAHSSSLEQHAELAARRPDVDVDATLPVEET